MMTIGRFGQNIGIAFQLVDDWLDFVASADQLGDYHHYLSMMIIMIIMIITFLRKTSWWSRSRPGHSHGSGIFFLFFLFTFFNLFDFFPGPFCLRTIPKAQHPHPQVENIFT